MSTETYLTQTPKTLAGDPEVFTWKPLRLFNLYRVTLAGLLTFLCLTERVPPPLGSYDPNLLYWGSVAWLAAGLLFGVGIRSRGTPFYTQVFAQVFADVLAITLLMHASGGIQSGMGMLLVISVASGSLLTVGRTAGLFGALATLALLGEQLFSAGHGDQLPVSFPHAGVLGATLFATAALAHNLARRIRETEALVDQRSVDLANMAELTRYIVQQVQVGVLAIDRTNHVRLMNTSAWNLLGRPEVSGNGELAETLSPALSEALERWRHGRWEQRSTVRLGRANEATVRFSGIGTGQYAGTVVFLEDASAATREVQQLKLAAVGRLTASIAHEIRNPLGAISHAGQLLAEAPELRREERRLVEIILGHSQRVNQIIESILQLSRRDRSRAINFDLVPWLGKFRDELAQETHIPAEDLRIEVTPAHLDVRFDPIHLQQILANLVKNALEHTEGCTTDRVTVRAGLSGDRRTPFIEVRDCGPGVSEEILPRLFEPFVSSRRGGTGLGLYISRQLAECNRAELEYVPHAEGGCFHLTLPDPELASNE